MKVAVVIPAYKVKNYILSVISRIGAEVERIYVVDDCCPEKTGEYVLNNFTDARIKVLFNKINLGVGGAVKAGYAEALIDEMDIIVKIDGDGQMSPELLPLFIEPIVAGKADFVKGNRFYHLEPLLKMPKIRLFGNSMLSLINKCVSGYWNIMDPTNGYIAIHATALSFLDLNKIENRYFFESDMLFRLNTIRAVIAEVPMEPVYQGEHSSLNIKRILIEFPSKYIVRFFKRLFYNYYLRDFNFASIELLFGIPLLLFGFFTGISFWTNSIVSNIPATSGQVMLSALPIIIGLQLLLNALQHDVNNLPKYPLQKIMKRNTN